MENVKIPDRVVQLYLSRELRDRIRINVERRGHKNAPAYLRELINEDYVQSEATADDDSRGRHEAPRE